MDREIGFHDSRPHMSFGHYALRAAIDAVSRRRRFSAVAAGKRITALTQALALDNATTLAVIVDTLTHSAEVRRNTLDSAIENFDVTANGVLRAVKNASMSLMSASGTMRSVSEKHREMHVRSFQGRTADHTERVNDRGCDRGNRRPD